MKDEKDVSINLNITKPVQKQLNVKRELIIQKKSNKHNKIILKTYQRYKIEKIILLLMKLLRLVEVYMIGKESNQMI